MYLWHAVFLQSYVPRQADGDSERRKFFFLEKQIHLSEISN